MFFGWQTGNQLSAYTTGEGMVGRPKCLQGEELLSILFYQIKCKIKLTITISCWSSSREIVEK